MADLDRLQELLSSLGGTATSRMARVDALRDPAALGGDPALAEAELSIEEQALLDRLAHGEQIREEMGTLPALAHGALGIAPYEALKAAGQAGVPGIEQLFGLVGKGFDAAGGRGSDAMKTTEGNTSPASFENVKAFFRGAVGRRPKSKGAALLSGFSRTR